VDSGCRRLQEPVQKDDNDFRGMFLGYEEDTCAFGTKQGN
jgi:hypothetical protein